MNFQGCAIAKAGDAGICVIEWARVRHARADGLRHRYSQTKHAQGMRIAGCLHVTKRRGAGRSCARGGEVKLVGVQPLSTQDDVAAALAADGIDTPGANGGLRGAQGPGNRALPKSSLRPA